jgi:hypothetical protein
MLLLAHAAPAQDKPAPPGDPAAAKPAEPSQPLTTKEYDRVYGRWACEGIFHAYRKAKPKATDEQLESVWRIMQAAEDPTAPGFGPGGPELRAMFTNATRHALLDVLRFEEDPKDKKVIEEYVSKYAQAIRALEAADISPSLQITWGVALGECRERLGGEHAEQAVKDYAHAFEVLGTLLRKEGMDPLIERMMYRRLGQRLERLPLKHEAGLLAVLKGDDIKSPWLAEMLAGAWHVHAGWKKRTGRLAKDVTAEGWAGFRKHLALAYTHFKKAHTLRPDAPEAATRLITVAMAGHTPEEEPERFWFDKAVAACFDWEPAYDAYMLSLEQRWGGSDEAVIAFGRECKATGRYDTDVPFQLFYACERVDRRRARDGTAWEEQYRALREMSLTYAAKGESWAQYSHTRLLALAWRTGNWQDGAEALKALGELPPAESLVGVIIGPGVTLRRVVAEVRAYAGPLGEKLEQGEALAEKGKWAEAGAVLDGVVAAAKGEAPAERAAVLELAYPLLQRADLMTGKPLDLRLEEGLPGWEGGENDRARFKITGPASLSANAASVMTSGRLGDKYVVEADLTTAPTKAGGNSAAIIVLEHHEAAGRMRSESTLAITGSKGAQAARSTGLSRLDQKLEPKEGPRRVRIQMWNEHWVVEVDGVVIGKGKAISNKSRDPEGDRIGFRAVGDGTFENIRIERLTRRPAALTDEADKGDERPAKKAAPAGEPEEDQAPFKPRF